MVSVAKTDVKRITLDDLVRSLGASMGQEKAKDVIVAAKTKLQITDEQFDQEQTLRILDQIATTPGLVGTVARFAKARVILLFG